MSPPRFTIHALQAMLARDVTPTEVEAALSDYEQRYTTTRPWMRGSEQQTVHQWRDIAVITAARPAGTTVITVLYRLEEQWSSEQGRPSGRRMSKLARRRLEAQLRQAEADERNAREAAA